MMALEELESLRKSLEADSENETLQARYEAALLRADQLEKIKELFRFRYLCPKRWSDLKAHNKEENSLPKGVRYCEECCKNVHYVSTYEDFQVEAEKGHCVAVFQDQTELVLENLVQDYAGKPKIQKIPSCVISSEEDPFREPLLLGMPIFNEDEWPMV